MGVEVIIFCAVAIDGLPGATIDLREAMQRTSDYVSALSADRAVVRLRPTETTPR
jgi:hypothetical protein